MWRQIPDCGRRRHQRRLRIAAPFSSFSGVFGALTNMDGPGDNNRIVRVSCAPNFCGRTQEIKGAPRNCWAGRRARPGPCKRTVISTHLGKMLTDRAVAETDEPRVHVTMVLGNRITPSLREENNQGTNLPQGVSTRHVNEESESNCVFHEALPKVVA